eukprot:760330-Hanusia_phi.AAC.1
MALPKAVDVGNWPRMEVQQSHVQATKRRGLIFIGHSKVWVEPCVFVDSTMFTRKSSPLLGALGQDKLRDCFAGLRGIDEGTCKSSLGSLVEELAQALESPLTDGKRKVGEVSAKVQGPNRMPTLERARREDSVKETCEGGIKSRLHPIGTPEG